MFVLYSETLFSTGTSVAGLVFSDCVVFYGVSAFCVQQSWFKHFCVLTLCDMFACLDFHEGVENLAHFNI